MKRKSISKTTRQKVLDKYGGHCAYCGKELDLKTLRVDHLHPHYLGGEDVRAQETNLHYHPRSDG